MEGPSVMMESDPAKGFDVNQTVLSYQTRLCALIELSKLRLRLSQSKATLSCQIELCELIELGYVRLCLTYYYNLNIDLLDLGT